MATRDEVAARLARLAEDVGGEWAYDEVFTMGRQRWRAFWRRFAEIGMQLGKLEMVQLAEDALEL